MKEPPKDCLSCARSLSTEDDKLFCVIKQQIVEEDDVCEDYN